MTPQEIIRLIQAKKPEITENQIKENLAAEKKRTGGLLGDETLLRLIAAKFGVEVPYSRVYNQNLSTKHLLAGLNDVSVEGRLLAIFQSRTFTKAEKSGKFATLLLADCDGILRAVLWDEKADMVDNGQLKTNQIVCLRHGYTKADRNGKVEMHLGSKSQIEIQTPSILTIYPTIEKFAVKINQLNKDNQPVFLSGTVTEVSGLNKFSRNDQSDGSVLHFTLADESGKINVVAWNEKADELQKTLKADAKLQLVNPKVKETQNGSLEVHVDSNCLAILTL
jgi:ssDNA-binding replication factor A large subunit